MTHFDERTIDLYVQNPTLLQGDLVRSIEDHLRLCAGCRGLVTFLQEYYRELNESSGRRSPEVEAIMQRLMPLPNVVVLQPYRPHATSVHAGNGYTSVMAAMSTLHHSTGETVSTLASEHDRMVVRIRATHSVGSYKIFLHTDDPRKLEGVYLDFPDIPAWFVLDDKGQVEFQLPKERAPRVWTDLKAIAHFPVAAIPVDGTQLQENGTLSERFQTGKGKGQLSLRYEHDVLKFTLGSPHPELLLSAVTLKPPDGLPYLIPLQRGQGELHIPRLPVSFVLRLYAGEANG